MSNTLDAGSVGIAATGNDRLKLVEPQVLCHPRPQPAAATLAAS